MQEQKNIDVQNPPKPKAKIGFLGYLWRFFLIFLALLLLFTGFFYFQRPLVTGWFMNLYFMRLSSVLVSADYYNLVESVNYTPKLEVEKKKPDFLVENFDQQFRQEKRQELQDSFQILLSAYAQNPQQDWMTTFNHLSQHLEKIFQDHKVTEQELDDLKTKVKSLAQERGK